MKPIKYNHQTRFSFSSEEKELDARIRFAWYGSDTNFFAVNLRRAFKEFWLPLVEAREKEIEEENRTGVNNGIPNFDMWFEEFKLKQKQNGNK